MNGKRIKAVGWPVAIVLAVALLIIAILIKVRREKKVSLISEKILIRKKPYLEPGAVLPQIEDIEGKRYLSEEPIIEQRTEPEEKPQEVRLKDLPLKKVFPEKGVLKEEASKKEEEEEEQDDLETSPSPDEIEKLKGKGLVIF